MALPIAIFLHRQLTLKHTPPQSSATNVDWHNDGTDQILSSLSSLLDWLSIPGWIQEDIMLPQETEMHHLFNVIRYMKQSKWKSPPVQVSTLRCGERDAMGEQVMNTISNFGCWAGLLTGNVQMTYSEWDILDPIFSDRDEISCHKDRRTRMNRRLEDDEQS
nr:hypothetical protein L203_05497 [Cryptococcus depauperatus CBS 7841]